MNTDLFYLMRPLLFSLPPETAHELTLRGLELGAGRFSQAIDDPRLCLSLWGLDFQNPIGIAAGFDKNARVMQGVLGLGCGFAEVGTVTPRPQAGNPKPRVFRLREDGAVINRLGFNNAGHDVVKQRLHAWVGHHKVHSSALPVVGVNIGANKDQSDRVADYVQGLRTFYDVAAYFMINISSPNTPGLRDLQAPAVLDDLLGRVMAARRELVDSGKIQKPIIVKISPDIAGADIVPIVERFVAHKVDGIAVSNTTLARPSLESLSGQETGGLSGRPLFRRSTIMLARIYCACEGRIPLVGIGGIDSGATALEKIKAGASLIQLYTALIYKGPGLVNDIKKYLVHVCDEARIDKLNALIGSNAKAWAAKDCE